MKSSTARFVAALLVATVAAATACTGSDPDFTTPPPGEPSPAADGGDGGAFPPVTGTPGRDSGADSGRDGGGDATTAAWSPKALPGLAVWLDSTVGITFDGSGNLTAWLDQSTNQNKAGPTAPCVAPTRAGNSLNGNDTVGFSGVGRTCVVVADAPSIQFGTGDFALFVVARYTNVPSLGGTNSFAPFWMKQDDGVGGVTFYGNGSPTTANLSLGTGGSQFINGTTLGLNDNTFRRFGSTRRGAELEVWVDGNPESKKTVTLLDVSQAGRPLVLGATLNFNSTTALVGNIAEVVAVKGNLTDAQIALLDGYFKTKHGL